MAPHQDTTNSHSARRGTIKTAIRNRITIGQGTTFLPGLKPQDPAIQRLIDQIVEHGYVVIPHLYGPEEVAKAIAEIERLELLDSSGPAAYTGRNAFEGFKTGRIYALADKGPVFYEFPIHPTVLALNEYFLQPHYQLTAYHTVNIRPGAVAQEIHTDDGLIPLPRPRPLMGTGTMIALDPFTATNGATTVIPGSHRWGDDRQPTRAETVPALMPAGSMVYFLNTVWHGGGANTSDRPRRSLTIQYCQPWIRTLENMTVAMGWEDLDRLPKALLSLMGFSTHDFMGQVDGRSPRAGVEMRKKRLMEWAVAEKEREVRDSKL